MQTLHCKGKVSRFRSPTDQIFESARGAIFHKKRLHLPSPSHTRVGEVGSQYLANQGCIDKMPRAKPTPETNINVSVTFYQEQPFTNIMRIFDPTPHGAVRGILSLISLFVWTIRSCSTMATAFQRGVNLWNGMYKKSSLVTKHKKHI